MYLTQGFAAHLLEKNPRLKKKPYTQKNLNNR